MRYAIVILMAFVYVRGMCQAQDTVSEERSKKPVRVRASVDKARVTIGDKIHYKVTVEFPDEIELLTPGTKEKIGGLTVKDFGFEDIKDEKGGITRELRYVLETYKIGSYIIPPLDITYKEKRKSEAEVAKTSEIFIEVVTTLDENASDVRDIKPPVSFQKSYYRLYLILVIVFGVFILAAVIVYFIIFHRKRREIESMPEILPAHQIAYNELESLRTLDLVSKGQIKEYYYRLSNIVRHYIENRFNLMAPERTTEEFFAEMTVTDLLSGAHKELVRNFMEHCDMVKFAAYGPDGREIENAFNSAKKLVDETREIVQEEVVVPADVH